MVRPLRIEYEGAVYHITSRGNAKSDIYLDDEDRVLFLGVLEYVVDRFGWKCHAYCLMSNHYHLMIETPQPNLSRGMSQLNGMFTQRFNRKHGRVGHVFQGRFKSIIVDRDAYLLELSRYIVRNPVAAHMVKNVGDWSWSSYRATCGLTPAPNFLHIGWLLSQFGDLEAQAQKSYKRFVAQEAVDSPWQSLNGPDVLGNDEFRARLQQGIGTVPAGVARGKAILRHLPLEEIAQGGKGRGRWMREAYCEHGYTMRAIADFSSLHHSTVSKLIKEAGDN
ncbi:MAG: transposase [Ghiorsea sp.]|nr:transposase [Ghiorsea sp.]